MALFTNTIRGDGLIRAHRALAGLEEDPLLLDRARRRFSVSPPPYTSDRSGTTTRSESPMPLNEEQRHHEQQQVELRLLRLASLPYEQFQAQTIEEEERLWEANRNRTCRLRVGDEPRKMAYETVKNQWVEQGIWNNKWNAFAFGRWKHEEPLELESESEADSEAPTPLFPLPQLKPRRPKDDKEKRRIAEQRVVREREREASRPYFQFVYQISKERERIQDESRSEEGATVADINSRAYNIVKATWIKRGIWIRKWGILPGMSWRHEEPPEQRRDDGPLSALADPYGHERVGAAPRYIFGSPSPAERHEQSVDVDSVSLENGDTETHAALNSRDTRIDEQFVRPTIGQGSRRSSRKPSQKAQPVVNGSLGPVRPSKVSKAARKSWHEHMRQPNISKKVSFGSLPSPFDADIGKPQRSRRSKRLQAPVPSVATAQTGTASTDPLEPTIRSRLELNVAKSRTTRSSAKPQGLSKRQPAKTARGRIRKE